jgi:hypothetical protein
MEPPPHHLLGRSHNKAAQSLVLAECFVAPCQLELSKYLLFEKPVFGILVTEIPVFSGIFRYFGKIYKIGQN